MNEPGTARPMQDERLIELESRVAFQEDMIGRLNDIVAAQGQQMDTLRQTLDLLIRQWRDHTVAPVADAADETPPPHY
jgi:SlyX protein